MPWLSVCVCVQASPTTQPGRLLVTFAGAATALRFLVAKRLQGPALAPGTEAPGPRKQLPLSPTALQGGRGTGPRPPHAAGGGLHGSCAAHAQGPRLLPALLQGGGGAAAAGAARCMAPRGRGSRPRLLPPGAARGPARGTADHADLTPPRLAAGGAGPAPPPPAPLSSPLRHQAEHVSSERGGWGGR